MKLKHVTIVLFSALLFFQAIFTHASGLFIINDKSAAYENDTVVSTVYINTSGKSINSAEGTINFPVDKLRAISVSTYDSVFNLWVEQPSFSNTTGTITFSGGVPNPGYNGVQGKVLQITFKALQTGSPSISFTSAALRLNDGLGTDISDTETGALVTIKSSTDIPKTPENPVLPNTTPLNTNSQTRLEAPIVTSSTMSDSERWYNLREATFEWKLPKETLSTEILLGSHPDSSPIVRYSPAISSKKLTNLEDGVWYLHVRLNNSSGLGKIAHRKIKIDLSSPSKLDVATTTEDGTLIVNTISTDTLSGIATTELRIDGQEFKKQINQTNEKEFATSFRLEGLTSGSHTILAISYDQAGNKTEKEFSIEIIAANNPPVITTFPQLITSGEKITVEGIVPSLETAVLTIKNDAEELTFPLTLNPDGTFRFTTPGITLNEKVSLFIETQTQDGNIHLKSNTVEILIKKSSPSFIEYANIITRWLSVIVPIIALITLIVVILHLAFSRIRRTRDITDLRITTTQRKSATLLGSIYNNVVKSVAKLQEAKKTRRLTSVEVEVLEHLTQSIEIIEKEVSKIKR